MNILNKLFLLLFLVSLTSCFTIVNNKKINEYLETNETRLNSFPMNSHIDENLIGTWDKEFKIIDMGRGTQLLHFSKNGFVEYKKYYKDYLATELWGEFRIFADTVYLKFSPQNLIEKYLITFNSDQFSLRGSESPFYDHHFSIENYPSRYGFIFTGK